MLKSTSNDQDWRCIESPFFNNTWDELLASQWRSPYFKLLCKKIQQQQKHHSIYPQPQQVYQALKETPIEKIKVVIIGQDPYHGEHQADGLAFSVSKGAPIPPSLRNIFKELHRDLESTTNQGFHPTDGNLTTWAQQGVLLLNTVLTVEAHRPGSHRGYGWELFTDYILQTISKQSKPVVFLLWGQVAKTKQSFLHPSPHLILTGAHPSPLSCYRGFFGGNYFSKANEFLQRQGHSPIYWRMDEQH